MTKILIAEDDEHTREALREVLTMEGYQVVAAADGLQAVDFFRVENPDFVCLDVMMPGLNGYEVCKQIRKSDEKVPILFLTAKAPRAPAAALPPVARRSSPWTTSASCQRSCADTVASRTSSSARVM
jgi:CheY-like chemotaxis protein